MRRPDHRRGLCRGVRGDERPGRGGRRQRGKPPSEPGNSRRGSCWDAALRGFSNAEPAPSSSPSKDPRSPPQRPPSVAVSPFLPLRSSPLLQPGLPPSPQQPPAPPHSPPGFGPLPFSPAPQPPGAFSPFQPSPGFPDQPYPRGRLPPAPLAAGGCGKRCPPPRRGSPLSRGGARPGPARGVEKLRRRREGGRASGRALRALKGGRPSSSPGGEGGRAKQEQQRQQQQQQQQAPPAAPGSSAGLYAPGSITARPGEEREGAAA